MAFKRAEIREILGEAYTDEIATKLVALHRGVVDPIKDDLDAANREMNRYKTEAEKVPGLQKELEDAKKGEDWKGKYEAEKKAHEDYKAQIAKDAETAKKKAAYKKLLNEERISEKAIDSILNATDYDKMTLKDDGSLDKLDELKKGIGEKWGGFKTHTRQRGENVDNPPNKDDNGGGDNSIRNLTAQWHAQRYGTAPQQNQNQGQNAPQM